MSEIAGQSIVGLAEQFGTPCYVYDAELIRKRIADLKAFPTIRFAQKACSNISILKLMREQGVVVDAVSAGEIKRALLAGYAAKDIVYTADVFDHAALKLVAELKLPVNCGSIDMIGQLAAMNTHQAVTLRINPGFGHGHSQKTNTGGPQSKHGIWHEELELACAEAKKAGLKVSGLHMHIGSGTDFEHLQHVCQAMEAAAKVVGDQLETVSAGGGLPTPYRPTDKPIDIDAYVNVWAQARDRLQKNLGKPVHLEVEPGRYLVAESGHLIAEIRAVKNQGSNKFYLINAGFNVLARPILYGAYHPISIVRRDGQSNGSTQSVVVGGPLCESGDIFTQGDGGFVEQRELPTAKVGDLLVFGVAGAYGFVMSSNYNSYPLVSEVLLDKGSAKVIRKRQTVDDMLAAEINLD